MPLPMNTMEAAQRLRTDPALTKILEQLAARPAQDSSAALVEALQQILLQCKPVDVAPALLDLAAAIRELARPKPYRMKIRSRDESKRVDEVDLIPIK